MKVVTGAAGFIGSCIVAKLNERNEEDLIVVDHFDDENDPKRKNLENKKYFKYYDKTEFINLITKDQFKEDVDTIIHMGACSSTTLQDADYFEINNFQYTKILAEWCLKNGVRFIYASSAATYGDGAFGYNDDDESIRTCKPLNLYGQSKQKFDLWALDNGIADKVVGLKFFNVFGPNEYHKNDMRSVVAKSYQRVADEGKISLFKSYHPDYGDGQQKRDFIYVKDVVDVVLFFVDNKDVNGIFNVGTGQAKTWNDLAYALFAAVNREPEISYIDMPEILKDKYQYFTQANMSKLFDAGYTQPFMSLEEAVKDYVQYLKDSSYW